MAYDVQRVPAEFATREAGRRARLIIAGLVVYFAVLTVLVVLVAFGHVSPYSFFVALSGALLVKPSAEAYLDRQINWQRGAAAERAVGDTLNELRREGWILMHDIEREYEGNLDHIASGPGGVFAIDTKLRRYEDEHLTKARRQAAAVGREVGVWVEPVIVLHERKKPKVFRHHGVSIVPRELLLAWLREQRNPPADFERLARFADRL